MEKLAQVLYFAWQCDTGEEKPDEDAYEQLLKPLKKCTEHTFILRHLRLGERCAMKLVDVFVNLPIKKIDLYGNLVREKGCEVIARFVQRCPTLTHLNLGGNDIPASGIKELLVAIETTKSLKILELGTEKGDPFPNQIEGEALQALVDSIATRTCPLRWLNLNRNPIGREDQFGFVALAMYLSGDSILQVLKLSKTGMTTETASEIFAALQTDQYLQLLDLSRNHLQPQIGIAMASLVNHKRKSKTKGSLQALSLADNPDITGMGFKPFFRSLAFDKSLTSLELTNTGLCNTGLRVLALALLSNNTITSLDLARNNFTEIKSFTSALVHNPVISYLNLRSNKIGDGGACSMASVLESAAPLNYLDMSHCAIEDKGAVAVGVGLANNKNLVSLNMSHNMLSPDAGHALMELTRKNKHLQTFDVSGTLVTTGDNLRMASTIQRNKKMKSEQILSHMNQEVRRLQYTQMQLHEAQQILRKFEQQRYEIERDHLATERFYSKDKEATIRRTKEVRTSLQAEISLYEDFYAKNQNKETEIHAIKTKKEEECKHLAHRLQCDRDYREDQTAELARSRERLEYLTKSREDKKKRLAERTEGAKKDREDWLLKQREYKELITVIQNRATEVEQELEEKKRLKLQKEEEAAERRRQRKSRITGLDRQTVMNELLAKAIEEEAQRLGRTDGEDSASPVEEMSDDTTSGSESATKPPKKKVTLSKRRPLAVLASTPWKPATEKAHKTDDNKGAPASIYPSPQDEPTPLPPASPPSNKRAYVPKPPAKRPHRAVVGAPATVAEAAAVASGTGLPPHIPPITWRSPQRK
eukprot:TRINITY_DN58120_c0_g1_i1.p1 TRINITY_DN58120_c0_g1~~TRINITY_DN58120_c0_g1_i1.p1  ORF type:complete len:817 (+),score=82.17 TRINITY_DN58120_c0_g1_i1:75-2525(+)